MKEDNKGFHIQIVIENVPVEHTVLVRAGGPWELVQLEPLGAVSGHHLLSLQLQWCDPKNNKILLFNGNVITFY